MKAFFTILLAFLLVSCSNDTPSPYPLTSTCCYFQFVNDEGQVVDFPGLQEKDYSRISFTPSSGDVSKFSPSFYKYVGEGMFAVEIEMWIGSSASKNKKFTATLDIVSPELLGSEDPCKVNLTFSFEPSLGAIFLESASNQQGEIGMIPSNLDGVNIKLLRISIN